MQIPTANPKPQYTSLIGQNVDGCDIYTIALSMYGRGNFVVVLGDIPKIPYTGVSKSIPL